MEYQQLYLYGAVVAVFLTGGLIVFALGDWIADRLAQKKGLYEKTVGKELHRLHLDISPEDYLLIHGSIFLGSAVFGYFIYGVIGAIAGLAIGLYGPRLYLQFKWNERIDKLNEQVEEAMVYMGNSFKANPSLPDAISDVVRSMPPPISEELNIVVREYRLGTPLDQALMNLQERIPSENLELAVSALIVGREVGGNMPKILDDISETIREAYRLQRFIDKTTKQGRMQAWVMGMAPVAVLFMLYYMYPQYATVLTETWLGNGVIFIAAVFDLIGVYIILQIIDIRI